MARFDPMSYLRLPLLATLPMAYLAFCALVSALLAYPLHFLLPRGLDYQALVVKLAQVLMILGFFPLGRLLGLGKADMGLADVKGQFMRRWAVGFGLGFLMMGLHVVCILWLEARIPALEKLHAAKIAILALKGFGVGIAVSSIEEPFFRGFLLGALLRHTTGLWAVLISAVYFAGLHFLRTDLRPAYDEVAWDTGFMLVFDAVRNLPHVFVDSLLALFAAGVLLGCVRLLAPRSGLGLCLGMHAGWIFVIKTTQSLSHYNPYSPQVYLVSHFDGVIGYLTAAWTGVLIIVLVIKLYQKA